MTVPINEMEPADIASEMQVYATKAGRVEAQIATIDRDISELQGKRSRAKQGLKHLEQGHITIRAAWGLIQDELHADTLYEFANSQPHISDYEIVRDAMLSRLHASLDGFHSYTESIDSPSLVIAYPQSRNFGAVFGVLSPHAHALIDTTDQKELVIPVSEGVKIRNSGANPEDLTRVGSVSFGPSVCRSGLDEALFYGDSALEEWGRRQDEMPKRQVEMWFNLRSIAPEIVDLLPITPDMTARVKKIGFNMVRSVVNGRVKNAHVNIPWAERLLATNYIDFSDDERGELENLIAAAKAKESNWRTLAKNSSR